MIQPAFEILNQRGTPMFFSDVFANRPTAGIVGRIFISTDTYAFYRDTGSGWDLIGGPGSGTITGSGTIGTLPIWNGTQVIGDSSLLEGASKFTTTKDFQADAFYLNGMTAGSGALYWTSNRVTLANYNPTGDVYIEVGGGSYAQAVSGTDLSTTFFGNIIRNGGLSTQFLKADGSLDSSSYVTTNIYNGNGTLSGNRVVTLNSNYLSFAGGQTYIGSQTASSGLLTINNANSDAHLQVVGANSPSIRIDNAGTGATQRLVFGLATATNNFIQGSTAGDICISTASASPLLFGMWQTINASEVMRISTSNNLLIGTTTDAGYKLYVSGTFATTGNATIGTLAGSGTRMVVADATGVLSTQSLPSGTITGSGTTNYVPKFTGSSAIGNSLIYDTGTNIGINTSSPARLFTINGGASTSRVLLQNNTSGSTIASGLDIFMDGTNAGIYNYQTGYLSFATSNLERMRLDTSGNLCIGSIIPGSTSASISLSIGSPATTSGGLQLWAATNQTHYVQFGDGSTGADPYRGYVGYTQTNDALLFGTSSTERGRFSNVGNLLIGTQTDGGYKLDVVGGGRFSSPIIQESSSTQIILNRTGGTTYGAGLLYQTSGTSNWIMGTAQATAGTDFSIYNYGTAAGALNITYANSNIQIGSTTDHGQKLFINGSLRIDGQTSGTAGGSSGQHLIINCDGTTYKIALLNN